jgi:protein transport protein SEC24
MGPGSHGTPTPPSQVNSGPTTRPFGNGGGPSMVSGMPPPHGQFQPPHAQFQPPPGQFQPPLPPPGAGGGAPPSSAGHPTFGAPPPNQAVMDQVGTKVIAPPGAYGAFPNGGAGAPAPQMSQQGHLPQPAARASNPPAAQGNGPAATSASSTFLEENVDWNIKHPKEMLQFTANCIPQSAQLSQNSKVVLGGVIRPFVTLPEGIPTVMPGPAGIVRCKKCRTYMNAFVSWMENGRRWRCNICGQANDCPSAYFSHLDPQTNVRRDKNERAELSHSVVEYIAPNEYMVRPPQPSAYFFVFDVSAQAVGSGMLAHVAAAIKKVLLEEGNLPGGERAQIGFLAYDTSVQYFNLSKRGRNEEGSGVSQPQMLTVSDLVELFVPLPPDDLLVNLSEHLDTVEAFLEALPTMFTPSADDQKPPSVLQNESALGPALKAAFTILKPLGGKMLVFNSLLPSVQKVDGCLNPRDVNPRIMGTDAENVLLRPQSNWYKDTAVEFSRAQISVDLFVTNFSYADVATLTDLPKYTAGNFYSFANFSPLVDGERLEKSVYHTLTRPTALEAVMRVRCTRGLRVTNFYGNFYIRGQDLLALPNCSSDAAYGFTIQHEDNVVPSNVLTVQSALLYTSTDGERRIRVITTVLPVVSDMKSLTNSVNVNALSSLLSKQGVDYALKNGPGAARTKLIQGCIDVIKTARAKPQQARLPGAPPGAYNQQGGGEEEEGIPPHLELLPLMVLGMVKNIALRGGTDVHPDERCAAMQTMSTIWPGNRFKSFLYPKLFRVDQMKADAGLPCDDAQEGDEGHTGNHMPNDFVAGLPGSKIRLPPMLNLTVNVLSSEGVYCLENGVDAFVWVGRQADSRLLQDLFGVESLEQADPSQVSCICVMQSYFILFVLHPSDGLSPPTFSSW